MFSPAPVRVALPRADAELSALLDALPERAAVFLLELGEGREPYLGRCANLRRRMQRVLRAAGDASRLLQLRGLAHKLAYWQTGSSLESSLVLLEQARTHFPERYRRMLRLRLPWYVRLLMKNRFPRVSISSQPGEPSATFGPFLYRSQAEGFAGRALDLFLLRRCEEELAPAPDHPGCIYGEMNMCLRPCQAAVSDARYREESEAFLRFLASDGESLRTELESERTQASADLDFEQAARAHKRLRKLSECRQGLNSLCTVLSRLHGVAVTPTPQEGEVRLWPVVAARLQRAATLPLDGISGSAVAHCFREDARQPIQAPEETMREDLAVLTKWSASTWCDGEWVKVDQGSPPPVRKIANAARRVHTRRWGSGVTSEGEGAADETKVLPPDDG